MVAAVAPAAAAAAAATAVSAPPPTPAPAAGAAPTCTCPPACLFMVVLISVLVPASPCSFVLIAATQSHPLGLHLPSCHSSLFGLIPTA